MHVMGLATRKSSLIVMAAIATVSTFLCLGGELRLNAVIFLDSEAVTSKPAYRSGTLVLGSANNETLDGNFTGGANEKSAHTVAHDELFPVTKFTDHVYGIAQKIDSSGTLTCGIVVHLEVSEPNTVPSVNCTGQKKIADWWCRVLERDVFQEQQESSLAAKKHSRRRILPNNVSVGISPGDYVSYEEEEKGMCLGNSSPKGVFAITNFLEVKRQSENTTYPIIPWPKRSLLPVWRGTAWGKMRDFPSLIEEGNRTAAAFDFVLERSPRLRAVWFSVQYPDLLDARLGPGIFGELFNTPGLMDHNMTNGLHRLLPISNIPQNEYYSEYQSALVLCGIGAAFRTSIHLSTETAVILQECDYHEWFTSYMVPWKHYIPLDEELTTLNETLHWIRGNPRKVRSIAKKGKTFYEKYLSFEANTEHFYELFYRLALNQSAAN